MLQVAERDPCPVADDLPLRAGGIHGDVAKGEVREDVKQTQSIEHDVAIEDEEQARLELRPWNLW